MAGDDRIPLARETVSVGKRRRATGKVVVRTRVHEERQPVDLDLADEQVEVRRVPVDRVVDGPVADRRDGDTLVVSVLREVVVVEKRLKVVEEIHVTRRPTSRHHHEEVVLRREEAEIERRDAKE